jgi:hypothetical protein
MKKYLFLLAIVLSGCVSTQNITWNTGETPGTLTLPEGTKKITLLDRVTIQYPYSNANSTVLNPNVLDIQQGAINGLSNRIKNQSYLTISNYANQFKHIANGSFPPPLTKAEIQQIGSGSDVLAALEMLDQTITDKYTVEIRRENLGNNVYREVDFFIGRRNITMKLGWRLYDTKTGEVLDEWTQEDNYFYEGESRERVRATSILNANYKRELFNLGSRYGSLYASRISPTSIRTTTQLYTKGNAFLVNGIKQVRLENWDDAEAIWLNGIEQETKRKKLAMLYHNLAMNEMRKGDDAQAKEYAKLAVNQHPIGAKTQSVAGY